MKKKGLLIGGGILIVLVLVAIIGFIVFTGNKDKTSETLQLNGTWCVYQYCENMLENEYMVFEDGNVSYYKGDSSEAFFTSSYVYENGVLLLEDNSMEYSVRIISDNNIYLVEPDTREYKLVRVSSSGQDVVSVTEENIIGEYDVISVAGEQRVNETMTFTESNLTDYRDGSEYLTSNYELVSDHILTASDIGKEFYVYRNGDYLILIDRADSYVWELSIS